MLSATGTPGSGNFLRGDGTWNTPSSAMTFISNTDISNAATYNFTAVDASSYEGYGLFLQNLIPVTDAVKLYVRTSTDGGSSYDADASDYMWGSRFISYTTDDADNQINIHGSTGGAAYTVGSDANESGCSGWIWVDGPYSTAFTHITANIATHTGEPKLLQVVASGQRLEAADVDAFQLLFSSGNIETGTVTAYGIANA